jgi:peptidoglycan/LPS O-acetylase OafA/YrhL
MFFSLRTAPLFGNPVYWTLALEEQLYLMYFAVPFLRRRLGLPRASLLVLLLTLIYRTWAIYSVHSAPVMSGGAFFLTPLPWPPSAVFWMALGPSRWFEWVLGALAVERAYGMVPKMSFHTDLRVGLGASVLAMLSQLSVAGWVFTDPLWGIAFFVMVNRVVDSEARGYFGSKPWHRTFALAGVWSYSLYLVHYPLVNLFQSMLLKVLPWTIAIPAGIPCALPFAWLFYRFIEAPSIHWARNVKPATTSCLPT